jgi:outer membrane immunogenic protein
MKKFLIAGVTAAMFCGAPALAADMPVKAPPPVPVPVVSWSGCYIGANTGGAWAHKTNTRTTFDGTPLSSPDSLGSASPDGWAYGGQIGCDYQVNNNWVVGIRGMWDGSNMRGSNQWPASAGIDSNNYKIDSFGTAVAKIGVLLSPAVEVYGVAGVATVHDNLSFTNPNFGEYATGSQTRTGYDVGVGATLLLTRNLDLFVEYDHMGFGTKNMSLTGVGFAAGRTYGEDIKQSVDKVLVGIDYRFDWGKAPVVAKY